MVLDGKLVYINKECVTYNRFVGTHGNFRLGYTFGKKGYTFRKNSLKKCV